MPLEALLNALRHRPFAPFRIWLDDGQSYPVIHPEMLILSLQGYAAVGVPAVDHSPTVAERIDTISMEHITRLEPISAAAVSGNGK